MTTTTSTLRQNIYKLFDHVISTGEPIEIMRKGKKIKITLEHDLKPIDRLVLRPEVLNKNIDNYTNDDWMDETLEEWKSLGLI